MASAVTINKKVPGKVLALGKLGDEAKKFEQEIRKKDANRARRHIESTKCNTSKSKTTRKSSR